MKLKIAVVALGILLSSYLVAGKDDKTTNTIIIAPANRTPLLETEEEFSLDLDEPTLIAAPTAPTKSNCQETAATLNYLLVPKCSDCTRFGTTREDNCVTCGEQRCHPGDVRVVCCLTTTLCLLKNLIR